MEVRGGLFELRARESEGVSWEVARTRVRTQSLGRSPWQGSAATSQSVYQLKIFDGIDSNLKESSGATSQSIYQLEIFDGYSRIAPWKNHRQQQVSQQYIGIMWWYSIYIVVKYPERINDWKWWTTPAYQIAAQLRGMDSSFCVFICLF